ncbi:hypothetical protein HZS61_006398 [Fusarium oxysporum f. sp. conglutinans]|uniref:Uncharacterized protein n=1 Tax=Fusarium oxysporum f. sp. conglutinans TaxID=100902 RepID=A0A8H6LBH3_FUSOX|nr:hypothetical protein HZS61_006398 [Fusarium oxysporum f. sp. conglutinans]KAG6978631.1 hypothetical protein FocnCong_v011796 [Fusarium oxysporum f. sp. conglutinans]
MAGTEPAVHDADGPAVQKGPTIVSSTIYELSKLKKELKKEREKAQGLEKIYEEMIQKGSADAWHIEELNRDIQRIEASAWPQHRELMMAREGLETAMREKEEIVSKFRGMQARIDELNGVTRHLDVRCCMANQAIFGYVRHIGYLERENDILRGSIEHRANASGAMAAEMTGLKQLMTRYQNELETTKCLNQSLYADVRRLSNKTQDMRAKLKKAEFDATTMNIHKQDLQKVLAVAEGKLNILEKQAPYDARTREETEKDLVLAKKRLENTKKQRKKPAQTKGKVTAKDEAAMAAMEKGLKDEIKRLTRSLEEKDKNIQEREIKMEELRARIKSNADEQESIQREENEDESDSRTVVAVEDTKVKEHSKIDEWYVEVSTPADELARLREELQDAREEIDQLKETVEGLNGVIHDQETEIQRRRQNETTLRAEADRQGTIAAESQEKLREKEHQVLELERIQTRANLKLIGSGIIVIEALVRDRTLLVQHVLETVAGRLDGIDSATSANRAFDEIDGFLENVTGHTLGCIKQAAQDASAVNGVVRNMRRLLPSLANKNDRDDVSRLFGEVQMFKTDVKGLMEGIKQELAGAGAGAIAGDGGVIQKKSKQKGAPRDRRFWLGFQPAELVFSSDLPKPERKKMTYVVDILSQLIVAMVGFWIVDRLRVSFKLSDPSANFQRACICIAICFIAVQSAQSTKRRTRTTREGGRAAVKTGPLTHR